MLIAEFADTSTITQIPKAFLTAERLDRAKAFRSAERGRGEVEMAGNGIETAHKGLRRLTAIAVVGLSLAGAACAQAAPPATAPGAAHATAAYDHPGNQPAGGESGHRVH
ncbi:MAG: hypothetical protein ACM3UX_01295 [Candidatus Woesearchaeota archaeon]